MPRKKTKKVARCVRDVATDVLSKFKDDGFDTARRSANTELLRILTDYLYTHPTIRFSQALYNLGIVVRVDYHCGTELKVHWANDFNLEPMFVLRRVRERK